jgi:polyisoprenoid-binding protein YceI
MRRIFTWLGIAVVLVAALAFAGWYFFLKGDAKPKAAISETPTVATSAPSAGSSSALDGTYAVKPGNTDNFVGYRVTEKLVANVVQTTATGRTDNVTGTLTISGDGTRVDAVTVDADLRDLSSDSGLRDGRIRSTGLESDQFPQATFVLTAPIVLPAAPAVGQTVDVDATGNFTLHGVTRSVTIPLEGRWDGQTVQVVGSLPITFADYNITAPSSPIVASVDDHGSMELKLFFRKQ